MSQETFILIGGGVALCVWRVKGVPQVGDVLYVESDTVVWSQTTGISEMMAGRNYQITQETDPVNTGQKWGIIRHFSIKIVDAG